MRLGLRHVRELYPLFLVCFSKLGVGLLHFFFFIKGVKVSNSLRMYHQYSNFKAFLQSRGQVPPPPPLSLSPPPCCLRPCWCLTGKIAQRTEFSENDTIKQYFWLVIISLVLIKSSRSILKIIDNLDYWYSPVTPPSTPTSG